MAEDRKPEPVVADRRLRPTGRGPRERRVSVPRQPVARERRQERDPWDDGREPR